MYHIFNRGVDKRDTYTSKNDYIRFYLSLDVFNTIQPSSNFEDSKNKQRSKGDRLVQIYAYSLLPNHFHLIVKQCVDGGISEFMKRIQGGYTSHFNEKYNRSGALFQGRFKRIHIDTEEYYQYLFVYVNENHYVHDVQRLDEVCYSSSIHYQNIAKSRLLLEDQVKYNLHESKELAKLIATQRRILKAEI